MDLKVAQLIQSLGLVPHPEGGHYRELFRSKALVQPLDARTPRAALTSIYFLLPAGDVSRWHRVASDEVWHFLDGHPLEILSATPGFGATTRHTIGPLSEGFSPEVVVSAGAWQAARSMGAWTLVGCVVAPGFDFADFELLRDVGTELEALKREHPDLVEFV